MSLTNVTIDDFSSLFAYSDAWTAPDTSDRTFPNGDQFLSTLVDATYHATKLAGKNATLSFAGTAIYLYGTTGPAQGFYDVNLDNGVTSAPVSAYAAANTTNHLLYSATGLTNTAHSVVLTNLGSMNGSGNELLIDYALGTALVGAAGATLTNTTVEDNNRSRLTYAGTWTSNNDTRFSGNTSTYTDQDGATVSLTFSGSAVYVFGDTVSDHGLFTVTLDGSSTQYNGKTDALKIGTMKYFMGGLSSSPHTLTITNNGATYFDIDSIVYTTPSAYASALAASSGSTTVVKPTGLAMGSSTGTAATQSTTGAPKASTGRVIRAGWGVLAAAMAVLAL